VTVLPSRDDKKHVSVTLAYLRWLYNRLDYVPAAVDQNAIGIVGYLK